MTRQAQSAGPYFQAETGKAIPKRSAAPADRVAAAAAEHERLRTEMEKDAKRAAKLEQKVGTDGYCPPRNYTHIIPSFLELNAIL